MPGTYDVSIPGEDLTGGTAGTPTSLANGSLAFDAAGNLTTPAAGSPVNVKTTTGLVSGANDLDMNWSLYAPDGTSLRHPVRANLRSVRHHAGRRSGGAVDRHQAGRRRNIDGHFLQR